MKGRHSDITSKIEPDGPKIRDDLFKRYTDCFAKTFKDIEWHRAQQENPQCIFQATYDTPLLSNTGALEGQHKKFKKDYATFHHDFDERIKNYSKLTGAAQYEEFYNNRTNSRA